MTHENAAVVYVATPSTVHEVGLDVVEVMESSGPVVMRIAGDAAELVSSLEAALREGRIRGAAVVGAPLSRDRMWMAYEWPGALVVEHGLEDQLAPAAGWRQDPEPHPAVRVFRLDVGPGPLQLAGTAAEFRESLTGARPTALDLDVTGSTARDRTLFGELADPRVGGAVALLMLSGATPDRTRVRLRNPAALDLEWIDDERSASRLSQNGILVIRAVGLSGLPDARAAAGSIREPDRLSRLWADRNGSWPYFVFLEAEALVDPELVVPVGQVFEQATVNGTQTLAAAASYSAVVTPGRLGGLLLPVWCLNSELSAPSGEATRATPLRGRYSRSESQGQVWARRAAVLDR